MVGGFGVRVAVRGVLGACRRGGGNPEWLPAAVCGAVFRWSGGFLVS